MYFTLKTSLVSVESAVARFTAAKILNNWLSEV